MVYATVFVCFLIIHRYATIYKKIELSFYEEIKTYLNFIIYYVSSWWSEKKCFYLQ